MFWGMHCDWVCWSCSAIGYMAWVRYVRMHYDIQQRAIDACLGNCLDE